MGERINDGGAAFPWSIDVTGGSFNPFRNRVVPDGEVDREIATGMTLRDWFAGQALAGLMADPTMNAEPKPVARVSYNYADAMLAARAASTSASTADGYTDAFYEISAMLGVGAKSYSPKEAFERDIKPRLQALLAADRGGA